MTVDGWIWSSSSPRTSADGDEHVLPAVQSDVDGREHHNTMYNLLDTGKGRSATPGFKAKFLNDTINTYGPNNRGQVPEPPLADGKYDKIIDYWERQRTCCTVHARPVGAWDEQRS